MIGGADKYMATCRRCHNTNVKIPCSPRPSSACSNNKENSLTLSNPMKRKTELALGSPNQKLLENNDIGDSSYDDLAVKKALFDKNDDEGISGYYNVSP